MIFANNHSKPGESDILEVKFVNNDDESKLTAIIIKGNNGNSPTFSAGNENAHQVDVTCLKCREPL